MSNPKWAVSIIAQYSKIEKLVDICYAMLIKSITDNTDPRINFYVLKYDKDRRETSYITYNKPGASNRGEQITLLKNNQNFYDSREIIDNFFNNYSLQSEADHHFVITWGHGVGFGLFREGKIPVSTISELQLNNKEFGNRKQRREIGNTLLEFDKLLSSGAVNDANFHQISEAFTAFVASKKTSLRNSAIAKINLNKAFRIVTMRDFAIAISNSFGKANTKINFLYCMNCYMQMFETGFLLRKYVDYFGTAENYQVFTGPDFDTLFTDLKTTDGLAASDMNGLAVNLIVNYEKKNQDLKIQAILEKHSTDLRSVTKTISEQVIVITRPAFYKAFSRKMNDLVNILMRNDGELYQTIRLARERCQWVSSTNFGIIDIAQFCKELQKQIVSDHPLLDILGTIINGITQINSNNIISAISNFSMPCATVIPLGNEPELCPHGLSIFFPEDQQISEQQQYVVNFMNKIYSQSANTPLDDFQVCSLWDDFIRSYYFSPLLRT